MDQISLCIQTDVSLEIHHNPAHLPIIDISSMMVRQGDATMTNGLLTGFLRLKDRSESLAAALFGIRVGATNHAHGEALSEHDMRDLGMLDGRVSPSTVDRSGRSSAWDMIERVPHSL